MPDLALRDKRLGPRQRDRRLAKQQVLDFTGHVPVRVQEQLPDGRSLELRIASIGR